VDVDVRAQLDLFDLDGLLLLARLRRLLLRLELVFAVVQDLYDRRARVRRDLDQIETGLFGELTCLFDVDDAAVLTIMVDELDLRNTDLVVDPGTLLDGGGSTIGTANGLFSLGRCRGMHIGGAGRSRHRRLEESGKSVAKSTHAPGRRGTCGDLWPARDSSPS
jgi:hypothetical protein